jgi:CRISPR-associated protein Cas1
MIAFKIIEEKVRLSHNLLKELSRYYRGIDLEAFEKAIEAEKPHPSPNDKRRSKDRLHGLLQYEGKLAALYWEYLENVFNQLYPEFNYQNRRNKSYSWNMNASDEINALLNYGYAILESQTRKAVNSVGLDMSVGFLHETSSSKTPLVYDLQEFYRWLIDLSVIQLLEEKRLGKKDFTMTENYHIRLKPDTAKMLIDKIRFNFNKKASYKTKNYAYENILLDNVQGLANHILDKNDLSLNIPLIKVNRDDNNDIRDMLAKMTSDERKKLGINKSTLWYIQKNLKEGKKIELYDKIMTKIV